MVFYRVSTEYQGESGLGLHAQQDAVSRFLGARSLLAEINPCRTNLHVDDVTYTN